MKHNRSFLFLLSLLLAVLFCSTLSACSSDSGTASGTAQDDLQTLPAYNSVRELLDGYTVVRSDISGDDAKTAMSAIRDAMNDTVKPATDWVNERSGETIPQGNREILIGATNRANSVLQTEALTSARPNHLKDFSITFYDGEVVIAGGSEAILPTAAQYFIDHMLDAPTADFAVGKTVTVLHTYPMDTVCGLSPADLVISAPDTLKIYAEALQAGLTDSVGYILPIGQASSGARISLSVDPALEPKQYDIAVKGDEIQMTAGNSVVLSSAVDALVSGAANESKSYEGTYTGDVPFTPGEFLLAHYRTALAEALKTAGYDMPITCIGAQEGFDATVTADMPAEAYSVDVTDTGITVRAGHYLALESALLEILSGKGLDGQSFSGSYAGDVPLYDGDRVLVWNDEFDGDTLDPSRWTLRAKMSQGDIKNGTDERNVAVADGKLLMRSWREDDPDVPYSTNTSVTTDGTMSFRYGYLEIYANVPFMRGAWPSYWTQSKDIHRSVDYMTEVDIFEIFGKTNGVSAQLHKWNFTTGEHCQLDYGRKDYYFDEETVKTLNNEYHRYGFGWTPTEMYFTVDGEIFFTHDITENGNFGPFGTMQGFQDPLFVIFNNFLFTDGSSWKPSEEALVHDGTEFPIEYSIEWIRLYQKPGEGDIFYDAYHE